MNPALFFAGMAAFALAFALTLLILRLVLVCGWLDDMRPLPPLPESAYPPGARPLPVEYE